MSEITLSKAVRSNLLNLQSTADLLGKSQERLSTGLRVNSALDNPTNFFTAQGLNSRANDLSQLLDSVSNAVQTVAAADKGITAITKLVEFAQATARQALQTSATVGATSAINAVVQTANTTSTTITGPTSATAGRITAGAFSTVGVGGSASATAGTFSAGAFSTVGIAAAQSAQAASIGGSGFATIDVSDEGDAGSVATYTAGSFTGPLDASSGSISFTLTVNGVDHSIVVDSTSISNYNSNPANVGFEIDDEAAVTGDDLANLINAQVGATVASYDSGDGNLVIAATGAPGVASTLEITDYTSTVGSDTTGLGDLSEVQGTDPVDAASITFSVDVEGGGAEPVTISKAAVDTYNSGHIGNEIDASALSVDDIASLINDQLGASVASSDGGELVLTGTSPGASSTIAISLSATAGNVTGSTGLADGNGTGAQDLVAATSISFTLSVDGDDTLITLDADAIEDYNTANPLATVNASALTAQNIADLINDQAGAAIADVNGGVLRFTSGTQGDDSNVAITGYTSTATGSTGIVNNSDDGSDLVAATSISFTLTVDGVDHAIAIDADSIEDYNTANPLATVNASALTAQNIADLINDQAGATIADVNGGVLRLTSTTDGADSTVAISGYTSTATGSTGIANATEVTGADATTGTAGAFTINGQTVNLVAGDTSATIFSKIGAAATGSGSGTDAFTVTNNSGVLTLTGTAGNDVVVGGLTAAQQTALGLSNVTTDGTPAGGAGPNPKRAELVETYNDLLGQIDALAKDLGFNGVNLLGGDDLSVLFNEDGTSSLSIAGIDDDAAGLGLTAILSTAFDTNVSINSTLDDLKGAIETLRGQSAKFGSNLSVVETRQDFTKNMINVLQTGASNLTLADTNEEAANVLALQTRQQLSSTALSLASQADQNVLRLF